MISYRRCSMVEEVSTLQMNVHDAAAAFDVVGFVAW